MFIKPYGDSTHLLDFKKWYIDDVYFLTNPYIRLSKYFYDAFSDKR